MELKSKPRENFYAPGLDMDRVREMLNIVIGQLSLEESLRLIREIAYDMVSYYGKDSKGIIYQGDFSQYHIEQATILQTEISTMCDLFAQSIVDKREFEIKNFEKYIARYQLVRAQTAEEKARKLEVVVGAIKELLV
jgi:hypothetical protein